mmetsp:Transcript_18828/g.32148  ORF Transcript_18828/g.32148 Transcript_18828/m.32148 type:complete len:670 (-) Transcript_18828:529-2538(-)
MAEEWRGDEDEAGEEEDDGQGSAFKDREHIVFLVDAEGMLEPLTFEGKTTTCFKLIMSTISGMMKGRIIGGGKDEVAVVFYNTRESQNEGGKSQKHVHVYKSRSIPDAATIRTISDTTEEEFMDKVGCISRDAPGTEETEVHDVLKNALWATYESLTSHISRTVLARVRHRVFMFSNNENPYAGPASSYRPYAFDRADQLHDIGATLRFFPLISCMRPFDMSTFWDSLLAKLHDGEDEQEPSSTPASSTQQASGQSAQQPTPKASATPAADLTAKIQALQRFMNKCLQKRRVTSYLRWHVVEGLQISVQMFNLIVPASKPARVLLRVIDNAPVVKEMSKISDDTGESLQGSTVDHKVFRCKAGSTMPGDRFPEVVFSVEELKSLKNFCQPGLQLIGFKQRSFLKNWHNLSHSSFVRPSEIDVQGSTRAFKALLESMLQRDRVAICQFTRSKSSEPVLVALLPAAEVVDEAGYQLEPEGMHLIKLPFMDDIRHPEKDPVQVGTADQLRPPHPNLVDAAKQLVQALSLEDFTIGAVPNPGLDYFYQLLQATALAVDPPASATDKTCAPTDMDSRAGPSIAAFKAELEEAAAGAPAGVGAPSRKRKAEPERTNAESYALQDWDMLIRETTGPKTGLDKLTADWLKIYLKFHNIKSTGNKPDLIERIKRHTEQ